MLVNAAGIGLFLQMASAFWIEPELADIPGASGGAALGWTICAVPIAVLFVGANFVWIAVALFSRSVVDRLKHGIVGGVVFLAWLAALYFDNAHHGM